MLPRRNAIFLSFSIFIVVCFFGCFGDDGFNPTTPPESGVAGYPPQTLSLNLAPSAQQQDLDIDRLVMTFFGETSELLVQEFAITPDQSRLEVRLVVPLNATRIRVDAFGVETTPDPQPILTGEAPITNLDAVSPQITVQLIPVRDTIRFIPSNTELVVGDTFTIEIGLPLVENLFAATFELVFDAQRLEPINVEAGSFFGENTIIFNDQGLDENTDRIGIAVAQQGGAVGVSGSGTIAVVTFRAKAVGAATVRFADQTADDVFTLQQPDGTPIVDFESIVAVLTTISATVNIQ